MPIPTLVCSALLLAGAVTMASAQDYPTRPIRFVVPVVAGGSPDILAEEGAAPLVTSPEEFGAIVKSDIAKWRKVAQALNIQTN